MANYTRGAHRKMSHAGLNRLAKHKTFSRVPRHDNKRHCRLTAHSCCARASRVSRGVHVGVRLFALNDATRTETMARHQSCISV